MRIAERGLTLLEVMIALAILGGAGSALVAALAAGIRSENDMRRREESMMAADRLLTAAALFTGSDLDRRIGQHRVGELVLQVQRPEPALYRISVAELRNPEVEMLVTVVYRPEAVPR